MEILRYLQSVVVTGRKLEIEDTTQCVEGETNFILVNRNDLIESAFDEIDSISDIRKTLEVHFYDEVIKMQNIKVLKVDIMQNVYISTVFIDLLKKVHIFLSQ